MTRGWPSNGGQFEEFCRAEAGLAGRLRPLCGAAPRSTIPGAWTEWPEPLRRREPQALAQVAAEHGRALAQEQALQFAFRMQWNHLREAAARSGIRILGDVAIFVNMDSADVWVHPEIFDLDEDLKPVRIAGVPPDYFSPTGQRWGNPLYRWDVLATRDFDWWIERDSPRTRALRHRAAGPLSRLRGVLVDSGRGGDGGERRVGEGAGAGAVSRTGGGAGAAAAGGRGPGR